VNSLLKTPGKDRVLGLQSSFPSEELGKAIFFLQSKTFWGAEDSSQKNFQKIFFFL